jgi:chromosome segregation ATPase
MGLMDIFRVTSIKAENVMLQEIIDEIGARDIITVKKKLKEYESKVVTINKIIKELQSTTNLLNDDISRKKDEIIVLDEEILLESFSLYKPKFDFVNSSEYKERLDAIRSEQKRLIKNGEAAYGGDNWTINNSKAQGRKLANDMKKLLLRSFNNDCDYCVDHVKFNNIDSFEGRIEKSMETCNKLRNVMGVSISVDYLNMKLEELYLAHEYQVKKQEEKEELKRLREEAREQQKLEQEIREAREKISKEKKHFNQAYKEIDYV